MTTITIPIELEFTVRPAAVMSAMERALSPALVATDTPAPAMAEFCAGCSTQPVTQLITPHKPGTHWPEQGGWYAGVHMTPTGEWWHLIVPDAHLKALDDVKWGEYGAEVPCADSIHDGQTNTAAMADAGNDLAKRIQALGDGLYLPARTEALLMFSTLKSVIGEGILWTSTQVSANSAWYQYFSHGDQYFDSKGCEFRAVPVRRLFL